jgi:DNA adenine methylase
MEGSTEQLRARVLVEIRERCGATCDEVEEALDLRHQTASARVNELCSDGKIVDSGERRKTRSGRAAIVWRESDALEPVLKWAGGKRFLLPKLRLLCAGHEHRRHVEPFVGSMAVALGLRPKEALLRDANPHLVNLHQWLQKGLGTRFDERDNNEKQYYELRESFNMLIEAESDGCAESAMLFYYLNHTGYNGLCRFNKDGKFNVPYGKRRKVNYRQDFSEYVAALAGWEIEHGSFEKTQLRSGDFVYLDPPYDGTFSDYSTGGFSWDQQEQLAEMFARHDGPVVASNNATARIINLYSRLGYEVHFITAPRSISSDGDRSSVIEMLAIKNLTWKQ